MEARILRTADAVDAIASEWDNLVLACPQAGPFLLAGWIATRMRTWPERRYAIVTGWRGARLVAGFAVVRDRRAGIVVAGSLGGVSEYYTDLLVAPGEAAAGAAVLDALRADGIDAVAYYGFPTGSALAEVAGRDLVYHKRSPILHAEMTEGYEEFLCRKLSAKSRSALRRKARHLHDLGRLEFERIVEPGHLLATMPELFRLHDARWDALPHGRDRSEFGNVSRRGFHVDSLERMAIDGYARMVVARVNSRAIAFSYWFAVGHSMFSYRLAFDPEGPHARFSPGLLTFLAACEMAADDGMRRIEFGRGLEEYKERLHDGRGWLYEGVGLAATSRGRIGVPALNTALRARRAAAALPQAHRAIAAIRELAGIVQRKSG